MNTVLMIVLAMGIDAAIGWPDALYRRIGHPVTWMARGITALDTALNHAGLGARARQMRGGLTVVILCALTWGIAAFLQDALPNGTIGTAIGAILAWPLIAIRSMHDHVAAVARPLIAGDLPAARHAVSMIVGRDPNLLDTAGVTRAGLESLAENTSDGIVAPVFWGAVLGLPGIATYKMINTMDSMIGHRNEKYEDFGKVAARLDDVVNLIPARLTGVIFAICGGQFTRAWAVIRADAAKHRSPNAGWPEGALAGSLNIRLSGPRQYGTHTADEPWLNGAAPDPEAGDLARGLALYRRGMVLLAAILGAVALTL